MSNRLLTPEEAAKGMVKIVRKALKGLSEAEKKEVLDSLSALFFQETRE